MKIIEWNKLCGQCENKCKQTKDIVLLSCPEYKEKAKQLTLDFKVKKK